MRSLSFGFFLRIFEIKSRRFSEIFGESGNLMSSVTYVYGKAYYLH